MFLFSSHKRVLMILPYAPDENLYCLCSQSSIYKHFTIDHDKNPPTYESLKDMFKVIYQSPDARNVKVAEVILIKTEHPMINIKYSEFIDFLKLF